MTMITIKLMSPDLAVRIPLPATIAAGVDALRCGVVALRVPLSDGAIQVGTSRRLPTATIEVRITPLAVEVRRTDGAGLQAQILTRSAEGAETATAVFTRPVDVLRVERQRGRAGWVVIAGQAARNWALLQLIETVVTFSTAKQAAQEGVARSA